MNGREQEYTENFITSTVNSYVKNREKVWTEQARIQRLWNWTFAIISFACLLMCGTGIRFFLVQGEKWDEHIRLQNRLSIERAEREQTKARQDSVMAVEYIKRMKEWDKVPYYKGVK